MASLYSRIHLSAAVAALGVMVSSAEGQSLLVNGDFATGTLAGWGGGGGTYVLSGEQWASMNGSTWMNQVFTPVPGARYALSFDLSSTATLPNLDATTTFSVYFDGNLLSTRTLPDAGSGYGLSFTDLEVDPFASASTIYFSVFTNFIVFQVDNVVLTAAPIPEPSTFACGAGLAVLGVATLRRRRRA